MPDEPAILAGRQSRAHLALSRALWLRQRGKTYAFHFDPAAEPGLTITQDHADAEAGEAESLLVGEDEGLIFCVASDPAAFLERLAAWAKQAIASVPALGILADAGAAQVAGLAAPIDAAKLDVFYRSELWDELLVPDEATIAAAIAATPPGERMWFWLTSDPGDYAVPLIVQPLAWDTNRDRTAWLIDRNAELGAGDGATGTCCITDEGTFQFLGDDLTPAMLLALAEWVGAYAAEYPALARLAHCRLLLTDNGAVAQVFADPELWTDVAPEPVAGTVAATAAIVAELPDGGECWFWITGAEGTPYLHLALAADDPEGEAFRAELPRLYDRFPQSHADAISGVMTKLSGERLLFVSAEGADDAFARQIERLLAQYGDRFPALRPLVGARLIRPGGATPESQMATPAQ